MQMTHMHKPNWVHWHKPEWVHWHKPDWHAVGIHLEHLIHDPRFWAGLALAILLGAMILATIFSKYGGSMPMRTTYPIYPYVP